MVIRPTDSLRFHPEAILIVSLLLPGSIQAQEAKTTPPDLTVGAKVRVLAPSAGGAGLVEGRVVALDDHALTIQPSQPGSKAQTIPRPAILTLEISTRASSRGRNAGFGALAGGVLGGVLGYAGGSSCSGASPLGLEVGGNFCILPRSTTTPALLVVGGLLGAAVGAASGHGERWESVRRSPVEVGLGPLRGRGMGLSVSVGF